MSLYHMYILGRTTLVHILSYRYYYLDLYVSIRAGIGPSGIPSPLLSCLPFLSVLLLLRNMTRIKTQIIANFTKLLDFCYTDVFLFHPCPSLDTKGQI